MPAAGLTPADVTSALAGVIRGQSDARHLSSAELVGAASRHGVAALVLAGAGSDALPGDAVDGLRAEAAAQATFALVRNREIERVLDACGAAGVRPLVIKGAHLSHAVYPDAGLRPRGDTDLLIDRADIDGIRGLLESCGYSRGGHVRGRVILGQHSYERIDGLGVRHALDVHWRVGAPLIFEEIFRATAVARRAVPIPELGPRAYGPDLPDALALACIHLLAHHHNAPRLVWLYDICLLARVLSPDDRRAFTERVTAEGCARLCLRALEQVDLVFHDESVGALTTLLAPAAEANDEPSAFLTRQTRRGVDGLVFDLRYARNWRTRVALLREHVYPDADYMRAAGHTGWLPWAYAQRALLGVRKWLYWPP